MRNYAPTKKSLGESEEETRDEIRGIFHQFVC